MKWKKAKTKALIQIEYFKRYLPSYYKKIRIGSIIEIECMTTQLGNVYSGPARIIGLCVGHLEYDTVVLVTDTGDIVELWMEYQDRSENPNDSDWKEGETTYDRLKIIKY